MKMGFLGAGFSLDVDVVASLAISAATPGEVFGFYEYLLRRL